MHYWLVRMRGGERVLEALCRLYPQADIFTHVYDSRRVSKTIRRHLVRTSFIQHLPFACRGYPFYLPLMPMALEQLDLRGYDLVISSEAGPAKGILCDPDAVHICYCHSPMRYIWDLYPRYREHAGIVKRWLMMPLAHYLRLWDVSSAHRVDHFVCNSRFVARRIKRTYGREAEVIHPPIPTSGYPPRDVESKVAPYLFVGHFSPNKGLELAVDAFNRSGRPLLVVSEGSSGLAPLKKKAARNIRFVGHQPLVSLQRIYANCRALVFPGIDEFGMVAAEAMAAGRPVIAYGKGGILDLVEPGVTGLFFDEQTATALNRALDEYEAGEDRFDCAVIADYARRFSQERFANAFANTVTQLLSARA